VRTNGTARITVQRQHRPLPRTKLRACLRTGVAGRTGGPPGHRRKQWSSAQRPYRERTPGPAPLRGSSRRAAATCWSFPR